MHAVAFHVNATVTLTPASTLNADAYNIACENCVEDVDAALDAVVERYADLGDWVVTVEGTQ